MIKDVSQKTVKALFGQEDTNDKYCFSIPAYQREYSWREEQWENLFNDIYENDQGYFLGSIICILPDKENSKNLNVIDGQQRLTTLSLLLLALYKKIPEYMGVVTLSTKDNSAKKYTKEFLMLGEFFKLDDELRIKTSIQRDNAKDYEYLVRSIIDSSDIEQPRNFGNRRISKAFRYFEKRLDELLPDNEGKELEVLFNFYNKITGSLIVKIDTEDAASAFVLFESINNRGMPLTPIDLIKNNLISKLGEDNPEEINQRWQQVINNLNDYEAQVRFLRHYYNAFSNVEDKIKIKAKDVFNVTKSGLLRVYPEIIEKHKEKFLDDIINKSKIYKNLLEPFALNDDSSHYPYKSSLMNLYHIGSVPANALLLFLFNKYPNENFSELLHFLEKWFIIRHITNTPSTNRLDNLFIDIIKSQKNKYDFEIIREKMLEQLYSFEDIKEEMLTFDIYEHSPKLTKCLLIHLEQLLETKESKKDLWKYQEKRQPTWTVEHIYPQNPIEKDQDEACDELVNRLGNLTLTAYNGNLSNRSFEYKLKLEKDGKPIGFTSGNIKINELLKRQKIWDSKKIEKRSEWLVDKFLSNL